MVQRPRLLEQVRVALERSRVVALVGPRQCGKTTLARELVAADSPNYFDLEDPVSLARLDEAMTALQDRKGLVVLDPFDADRPGGPEAGADCRGLSRGAAVFADGSGSGHPRRGGGGWNARIVPTQVRPPWRGTQLRRS